MSSKAAGSIRKSRRVLMLGTSPKTMGGIATVVQGYRDAGLFEQAPVEYIVTHRDGTAAQKLGTALHAFFCVLRAIVSRDRLLFHVHLSSRASFWRKLILIWLIRIRRHPYLIHLHGSEFMAFYNDEAGAFGRKLIQNVFNHASLVFALSPEWRDLIASFTPNTNIIVLPNGVPVPALCPDRGARTGSVRILFLGRLGKRKGIYDLLSALSAMSKHNRKFELFAAGDGEIAEVRELAEKLGLGACVHTPGWIDADEKLKQLADADIFVLPSHAEGLPMSLLEAMAAGLPVICSTVGGIPLAVTDGREGLLIAPGDIDALRIALERLIDSEDLRAALGRQAHARARSEFSVDSCVTRLLEIYSGMGVNVVRATAGDSTLSQANANQ